MNDFKIQQLFQYSDQLFSFLSSTHFEHFFNNRKEISNYVQSLSMHDITHILNTDHLNSRLFLGTFLNQQQMIEIATKNITDKFHPQFFLHTLLNKTSSIQTSKEDMALVVKTIYSHKEVAKFQHHNLNYILGFVIGQYISNNQDVSFFHHITKAPFITLKNDFCLGFKEAIQYQKSELNAIQHFTIGTFHSSYENSYAFETISRGTNGIPDYINIKPLTWFMNMIKKDNVFHPLEYDTNNHKFLWFLRGMNPEYEFIHQFSDEYDLLKNNTIESNHSLNSRIKNTL